MEGLFFHNKVLPPAMESPLLCLRRLALLAFSLAALPLGAAPVDILDGRGPFLAGAALSAADPAVDPACRAVDAHLGRTGIFAVACGGKGELAVVRPGSYGGGVADRQRCLPLAVGTLLGTGWSWDLGAGSLSLAAAGGVSRCGVDFISEEEGSYLRDASVWQKLSLAIVRFGLERQSERGLRGWFNFGAHASLGTGDWSFPSAAGTPVQPFSFEDRRLGSQVECGMYLARFWDLCLGLWVRSTAAYFSGDLEFVPPNGNALCHGYEGHALAVAGGLGWEFFFGGNLNFRGKIGWRSYPPCSAELSVDGIMENGAIEPLNDFDCRLPGSALCEICLLDKIAKHWELSCAAEGILGRRYRTLAVRLGISCAF
jgi:hypothetical protein